MHLDRVFCPTGIKSPQFPVCELNAEIRSLQHWTWNFFKLLPPENCFFELPQTAFAFTTKLQANEKKVENSPNRFARTPSVFFAFPTWPCEQFSSHNQCEKKTIFAVVLSLTLMYENRDPPPYGKFNAHCSNYERKLNGNIYKTWRNNSLEGKKIILSSVWII